MAKKTVLVSDMSGKTIAEGRGATLRITYEDARRGVVELDVSVEEVDDIARRGRRVARRGRKPKTTS